jgi:hypothetical protein
MQFVYANVYLIPTSIESKYKIFKALIRFGESSANKFTNLGTKLLFYITFLPYLSNAKL